LHPIKAAGLVHVFAGSAARRRRSPIANRKAVIIGDELPPGVKPGAPEKRFRLNF
jgi:hypothetical protein